MSHESLSPTPPSKGELKISEEPKKIGTMIIPAETGFSIIETTCELTGDDPTKVIIIDGIVQHPLEAPYESEDLTKHMDETWLPRRNSSNQK